VLDIFASKPFIQQGFLSDQSPKPGDDSYWDRLYDLEITPQHVAVSDAIVIFRKCRIPAFIQTLGMLFFGQGLIQLIMGGYPVYPLPKSVSDFGMNTFTFGLGWSFAFFIASALVADFVLRRTVLGRNLYATGGNREVARLVGINTAWYKIGAFMTVGALAAVAGMFVMADLQSGTTSIGSGWELVVIAGGLVGGAAPPRC